ncbi:MAG TPA: DNA-3-methyladenine glycosylase 2 family protein [Candidatus Krumholzibacteria bacterium]|nr:DNA-3-methyladenine glycosylase 2 family protein [Candidatus Krumholzibacteria bacterium]
MPQRSTPNTLHDPDQRRRGRAVLRDADPALGDLVERFGDVWPRRRVPVFERLCRIVIDQQLSVKAAATIAERLRRTAGGRLRADRLHGLDDAALRGAGLSRQKTAALRDLVEHVRSGRLRTDQLWRLPDDEITERLGAVRGFGPWSVEMFLLFGLGRADVWATGDLGLRRAVQELDGHAAAPHAPAMIARAERWRPWRGLASLYLWASLEPVLWSEPAADRNRSL